jgi:hypothetical protein
MEQQEKYLGGITSYWLTRGLIRGYAIHVTNKRIIGVKKRKMAFEEGAFSGPSLVGAVVDHKTEKREAREESDLENGEGGRALEELLKNRDIEIQKTDIYRIKLKKPGKIHQGHLRILLLKSTQEFKIKIGAPYVFERVGQLMRLFYPEVVRSED